MRDRARLEGWAIALGALALRLYRLGAESLWLDEVHTLFSSQAPLASRELAMSSFSPPLHGLVLQLWTRAVYGEAGVPPGGGEWALRFPSAVAGAVAVLALHRAALLLYGRREARWAAILFALAPLQVWYSREARGYALVQALGFLSTWSFLLFVRNGRPRDGALYALSGGAAVATHYPALFLLAAHGLWQLLLRPGGARRLAGSALAWAAILGGVALPLVLLHLRPLNAMAGTISVFPGERPPLWMAVPFTLYTFCVGYSWGPSIAELRAGALDALREYGRAVALAAVAFGAPMLRGAGAMFAERDDPERRRADALVALWTALPLGLALVATLFINAPYNVRYALLASGGLALLAARGLAAIRTPRLRRLATTAVLGVSAFSLLQHYQVPRYAKEDARSAARWVEARARPGDRVLVESKAFGDWPWRRYFTGDAPALPFPPAGEADDAAIAQALAPFARPAGRLFLVEARVWEGDPERRARAWIAARARPLEAAAFAGVKVTLYSGLRPEAEGASGP